MGPAALALAWVAGCRVTQTGATDAELARARERTARGATLFSDQCAHCHGRRGEGRAGAPSILGALALPEFPHGDSVATGFSFQDPQDLQIQQQTRPPGPPVRGPFRSARDLYDFLGGHVPEERVRSWRPDDSWAVVTFLMAAKGCELPKEGIGPGNAGALSVRCPTEPR
jgi:hypothetical protein